MIAFDHEKMNQIEILCKGNKSHNIQTQIKAIIK